VAEAHTRFDGEKLMAEPQEVPYWTLSTGGDEDDALVQRLQGDDVELSQDRLQRLRVALAAMSDNPPIVMERYALALPDVPQGGRLVAAGSPLAKQLGDIIGTTRQVAPVEAAAGSTEVLYRMVVPERLASQLAQGTAKQMVAKDGGVYSAVRGAKSIVGNTRFVPVSAGTGTAGAAGAGGAAAAAGLGSVGAVGAVVAAAPVVLLLAATAGSIYAEEQRRRTLERVEEVLNTLKADALDEERDDLNGAVAAITKATALLADEGRLGMSLGLDSAVNRIDTAVSRAERRVRDWERAVVGFDGSATPDELKAKFPGLGASGGEFEGKLRMACFAIAMKRRVAILQAAEHTQADTSLSLSRFNDALAEDTGDLAQLEQRIVHMLTELAHLKIAAPARRQHRVGYRPGEVRELLSWTPYLRTFADRETPASLGGTDLELCFVANDDGSIRVLQPVPAGRELGH
jgi:hypothetical protein